MKILFWVPPWEMQGDLLFFNNAFRNHLLPQANTLAEAGHDVHIAIGGGYLTPPPKVHRKISIIALSQLEAARLTKGHPDIHTKFHLGEDASLLSSIITTWLAPLLPSAIDIVLLWEAPAPFFSSLYPDAVVVSQMPGTFSRAPYPHLVTFDPIGLYRHSSLVSARNLNAKAGSYSATRAFADRTRTIFANLKPFPRASLLSKQHGTSSRLSLLPLQISAHYAFKAETRYASQLDLLLDALASSNPNEAIVITQYVSRLYSDRIMSEPLLRLLTEQHPNVIYKPRFDEFPTISQFILPECDEVLTASSSLGLQALIWDLPVRTFGSTGLAAIHENIRAGQYSATDILSAILLRQQPLAELVLHNATFLSGLLEDVIGRRKALLEERLPNFLDHAPDYGDKLLQSFREQETHNLLTRVGSVAPNFMLQSELRKHIGEGSLKAISFDIFDTLVARPLERPADAYRFLQIRAEQASLIERGSDLAQLRLDAELLTRRNHQAEEITLDEIYHTLGTILPIAPGQLASIKLLEISLESELSRSRPVGRGLWDIALNSGLPILICSDMYLPEEAIEGILSKESFVGYSRLYVSSTTRLTKRSGKLFEKILSDLQIQPHELIHIGDNPRTDIGPASRIGIKTLHVPSAVTVMATQKPLSAIFARRKSIEPPARSLIVSAIARELFDNPRSPPHQGIFGGDPYKLGYCGLGPIVFGYANWIRHTAARQSKPFLYFLSREGLILKEVFDMLCERSREDIRSTYLWGSRRAIRVSALRTRADLTELARHPVAFGAPIGAVVEARYGLKEALIPEGALRRCGFMSLNQNLHSLPDASIRLAQLAGELADEILENAARERETYLQYLASIEFSASKAPAIVDIGWSGNIQASLGRLINAPITGFYYSTLADASKWCEAGHTINSYSAHLSQNGDNCALLSHRHLAEYLLCEAEASIEQVVRDCSGAFRPVRNTHSEANSRRELIMHVHRGVRDFTREMLRGDAAATLSAYVDPSFGAKLMQEYFLAPHKVDASLLAGHYQVDEFGGLSKGYFLLPPKDAKRSEIIWRKGHEALTVRRPSTQASGLTLRNRLCLLVVYPFLAPHLSESDRERYKNDPKDLFGKARHPDMVRIGRFIGLTP